VDTAAAAAAAMLIFTAAAAEKVELTSYNFSIELSQIISPLNKSLTVGTQLN